MVIPFLLQFTFPSATSISPTLQLPVCLWPPSSPVVLRVGLPCQTSRNGQCRFCLWFNILGGVMIQLFPEHTVLHSFLICCHPFCTLSFSLGKIHLGKNIDIHNDFIDRDLESYHEYFTRKLNQYYPRNFNSGDDTLSKLWIVFFFSSDVNNDKVSKFLFIWWCVHTEHSTNVTLSAWFKQMLKKINNLFWNQWKRLIQNFKFQNCASWTWQETNK